MSKRLEGKVTIVTGAGHGIGSVIAKAFAREGANVAVNFNKSKEGAQRVVRDIRRQGGEALAVKADVSDPSEVNMMVSQVVRSFGTVDVLVNNAGVLIPNEFLKIDPRDWDRVPARISRERSYVRRRSRRSC